jgi:hypothetical protein
LLNSLYGTDKFIFNEALQERIYKVNKINESSAKVGNKNVVFFTEPRDIGVNKLILKELISANISMFIQLHPNDSVYNYEGLVTEAMILNRDEANLVGNVCISRKSTVLIEASYNNSVAIAYTKHAKDCYYVDYVFPSLRTKNVKKISNIECLKTQLLFLFGI